FSGDIASKIYAGSDMFLMPSKFEPCGLSQLIAMRYGSVPIVRETGGLKDTVIPFNPEDKTGRGFTFKTYNAYDMLDAIKRALGTYANKEEWNACMKNAMSGDYSWKVSAKQYIDLYKGI
ncbi:MAG: glycosyltransferase, partial [Clostridia bacterium]|nr:glycosyltransferase [Clostridia bacterium]